MTRPLKPNLREDVLKLIVQIPCYNEEQTLPATVADIPRQIDGIDRVEVLVVDDGSADRTVAVARELGVDHIVRHTRNRGLAATFRTGLDTSLKLGADIIVNMDGDNQYPGSEIPRLIRPILDGEAEIVIGDRQTQKVADFSGTKKLLQKVGSAFVSRVSGVEVPDVVSGFRAYTREAALSINVVSSFSYTVETVIQAGNQKQAISTVPIDTNRRTRASRLMKSIPSFILNQVTTIIRIYAMYRPLRTFTWIGGFLLLIGIIPIIRFVVFYFMGEGSGHIQSLILGGVVVILGFNTLVMGLLSDLIGWNRKLLETVLEKTRRIEIDVHTETVKGRDDRSGA